MLYAFFDTFKMDGQQVFFLVRNSTDNIHNILRQHDGIGRYIPKQLRSMSRISPVKLRSIIAHTWFTSDFHL